MDEHLTETEQISRQSGDIESEEQIEIEQKIEDYKRKIDELDAQLEEYKSKAIDDKKRALMRKWNYTNEQIERYISHIEGETSEDIQHSIIELTSHIPPRADNYADPSPLNGAKYKPAPADPGEIGKTLFERIKHKI